jgi:HEAT repeat protein
MRSVGFVLAGLLALTGCPKDEFDPDTWIDKLENFESPADFNNAVSRLEQLNDPKAIKPLKKAWEKYNRAPNVLRAIVRLAEQEEFDGKQGPFWTDEAIAVLETAVGDYDTGDPRSIEDAMYAADALGRARKDSSLPILVEAATKKLPKLNPGQNVRIAALRALGNYGNNTKAVQTLVRVLEADLENQDIRVHAAAANALAATGSTEALQPLLMALYRISAIFQQVRRALTVLGADAIPELVKVFEGKHAELSKFAKENNFATDCDKLQGPDSKCTAPGNLRFKAATLLGDLYAKDAAQMLAKSLRDDPKVAFFDPSGAPGPYDHAAVLDALRKIGDPSTASAVLSYARSGNTDNQVRPIAIDVYSMLASGREGLGFLSEIVEGKGDVVAGKDVDASDPLIEAIKEAGALGYARLASKKGDLGVLEVRKKKYLAEAAKYDKKAEKSTKKSDKAYNERSANQYRATAQLFEEHLTRARVGVVCGDNPDCYVDFVKMKPDAVIKKLEIKGKLKKRAKNGIWIAAQERALLELGKMGPKAKDVAMPVLLEKAESTDRIVRQGVLLALVTIAGRDCKPCSERLAKVIQMQKSQSTLDYLTADTQIVLNFFNGGSSGGK